MATTLDKRTAAYESITVTDIRRPSSIRRWRSIARFVVLSIFAVFWVAPVLWMIATSLKPEDQTISDPPRWFPNKLSDFTLENYDNVLFVPRGIDIIQSFQNSLFVAVVGAALTVLINVPAGYVFARMRFRGRDLLFAIVIASLIVPGEILLVPNYVTIWKLGWLNDYRALILPPLASAFGVFLMRQFMLGIPRELEDAAKLDGAGHVRILWNIVIPATRGAIAALAIFTFLFYWNEFTWPYITINQADRMTLPVALIQFRADFINTNGRLMAGAAISALPAIAVFLVAQRMIIRSITLTGIKG
ncbi:MAG: carbohydrate ABC transporter permease [Thermomicrobiales bacterium]